MPEFDYQQYLEQVIWKEGHIEQFAISYRHAIVFYCSKLGRQKAQFANGEYLYFAYIKLIDYQGDWISHGANFVPVLPDNRLIMVVEQRPTVALFPHPRTIELEHGTIDLEDMGSLEFPGGAISSTDKNFTAGFVRQLEEETEVEEQTAVLYHKVPSTFLFGSDIALAGQLGVIYLKGFTFSGHVESDGGLSVHSLSSAEIIHNIRTGAISSGQAALLPWGFYQDLQSMIENGELEKLIAQYYISKEVVTIKKPS